MQIPQSAHQSTINYSLYYFLSSSHSCHQIIWEPPPCLHFSVSNFVASLLRASRFLFRLVCWQTLVACLGSALGRADQRRLYWNSSRHRIWILGDLLNRLAGQLMEHALNEQGGWRFQVWNRGHCGQYTKAWMIHAHLRQVQNARVQSLTSQLHLVQLKPFLFIFLRSQPHLVHFSCQPILKAAYHLNSILCLQGVLYL